MQRKWSRKCSHTTPKSFGSEASSLQEVPARKARLRRGATMFPPTPPLGQQEATQVLVKHTKMGEAKKEGNRGNIKALISRSLKLNQ